ncbi:MAG: asparagine synthase (glutamine-hydrolyzing) [Rhodospirillales bacterium]
MCGLAGVFASEGQAAPEPDMDAMLRAMVHRGPDGEGRFVSEDRRCQLGFRRLAVIDRETGNQPLYDEAAGRVMVGNGEIYNYQELRAECAGYPFQGKGDMETVLALAQRDGDGFVHALNGMYALALYDRRERRLMLVRDRLGVKPLYYARAKTGALVFASEIKPLFASGLIAPEIDETAVTAYLAHGWVPAPMTLFKGVCKLPPGARLTVSHDGAERLDRYWSAKPAAAPQPADAEQIAELLEDSVRLQLRSDAPIGALLSGGIDSGLITALASKHAPSRLKTFTVSFEGAAVDEAPLAQAVADRYGTDHTRITVPAAGAGRHLPMLAWRQEEPLADAALLPNWLIERELAGHVTVALNGTGGDELFAGYGRYFPRPVETRFARLPAWARTGVLRLSPPLAAWKLRRAGLYAADTGQYVHDHTTQFPPPMLDMLGARAFSGPCAQKIFADEAGAFGAPAQTRALAADINTYLPDDLLMLLDRTSMAHSVEGRVPFLDHRLVEAALSVPPAQRTPQGRQKGLLRAIAEPLLPPDVLAAPKHGFASPVPAWMQAGMGLAAGRLLCSKTALARGWWTRAGVERLLAQSARHGFRIYTLLMLELTVRLMTERSADEGAPDATLDDMAEAA